MNSLAIFISCPLYAFGYNFSCSAVAFSILDDAVFIISLFTNAGCKSDTETPCGLSSFLRLSEVASKAYFDAEYGPPAYEPGVAPAIELTEMTRPFDLRSKGKKALVRLIAPK